MQTIDNNVMDKIKALLRMAEHENSNEHEAALAMEKAQALLLRHNLTRASIITDGEPAKPAGIGQIDITIEAGFDWKQYLMQALTRNNLCNLVVSPSKGQFHIFGSYDNVKSVLEMYHWIAPELERMALAAWKRYQQDGTGTESVKKWKYGFFLGAVNEIELKLKPALDNFRAGEGHAIVPMTEQMIKEAVKRVYPRLTSRYSHRSFASSGLTAGRNAGAGLNIRPTRKLSGAGYALKGG